MSKKSIAKKHSTKSHSIFCLSIMLIIILSCMFLFTGCADTPEVVKTEYNLYFTGLQYAPDTKIIYAFVKLAGESDQLIDGLKAKRTSSQYDAGIWYNGANTNYILPFSLYSVVDGFITQDERENDGVSYETLKVNFQYDTIYKSVTSNGTFENVKEKYYHTLTLDGDTQDEATELTLSLDRLVPNSASWYSVLMTVGLLLGVISVAIALVVKRKKWKRKQENPQEECQTM